MPPTYEHRILAAGIDRSEIPEIYRRIAPRHDRWTRWTESKAHRRGLELAAIRDGDAVLEVAVGTGSMFAEILEANPTGINEGVDVTEEMLARARRKAEKSGTRNYRLLLGDAYDLDYPDETFDVLVNGYMFDMLPERDFPVVLAEFDRVLRPGGRLVVIGMTKAERWRHRWWEWIFRLNARWLGGCRGVRLLPHVEAAGFVHTRRDYISQMTFPSEVVYGVKPHRAA